MSQIPTCINLAPPRAIAPAMSKRPLATAPGASSRHLDATSHHCHLVGPEEELEPRRKVRRVATVEEVCKPKWMEEWPCEQCPAGRTCHVSVWQGWDESGNSKYYCKECWCSFLDRKSLDCTIDELANLCLSSSTRSV
jgi:hypothetical protein